MQSNGNSSLVAGFLDFSPPALAVERSQEIITALHG